MVCLLVFTNTGICSTVNFKNKLRIKHCCCLLVYLCQLWAVELLRSWELILTARTQSFYSPNLSRLSATPRAINWKITTKRRSVSFVCLIFAFSMKVQLHHCYPLTHQFHQTLNNTSQSLVFVMLNFNLRSLKDF